MFYQRFTFRLLTNILLINALSFLLGYLILKTQLWFTIAGVSCILIISIFSLYNYINQIRADIKRFILAVKTRDHTLNFRNKSTKGSFPDLYESFDEIIRTHKDIQLEQDAMFQLIRTILQQVPVGVIVLKDNTNPDQAEISFFNEAAAALLKVPSYKYWHRLKEHLPIFTTEIESIQKGGKRFLELKIQEKLIQLSTEVIPINLYSTNYRIISFQNIKDEIEQKEIEAWNRLIGVISHEILNSITPISSLSDTVNSMVSNKDALNKEELEDLKPAIQAIKRRSLGLLDFVKDYRLIAELPTPELESHSIGDILQHIQVLMQPFAAAKNVKLSIGQTSSKITVSVDLKLVEQAMINLITNSIHALEEADQPEIEIDYRLEQNKLFIDVSDNGKGIEPELAEKIFVPFFTTRKNGSGIGLTITRNIMKMHYGSLEVSSVPHQKTIFSLVFNYV
ncbi:nitrogen fixation/metabolism regulation signal transduction histidine kinase [Pedobacter cryoconitis]|uniref:sensor histidine kinase n=1 Tax=Pedobacter cryoconitis TaxID=188932 RepID=UPI0016184F08|nr:HAMP domain-containing sensor histidine kinase [Pedobacter cryoconitis]MBB6269826.1 nitrogen fixation/metabolism regulation signal transduction histidine kinase [Pedobacter cryoconitis]